MAVNSSSGRAVQLIMRQAQTDAAADLHRHHERALDAARDRVCRLISTARPGAQSAHARYDAAARVLRGWYLEVHAAALDQRFGGTSAVPGSGAVDATAALIRRIRTREDPQGPLRAAAVVWRLARVDADSASVKTLKGLRAGVAKRATTTVSRVPVDDELIGAILRHWYQRCYLEAVDARLGLLAPLRTVTQAEAQEVAASVEARQARRIVGTDGVPLVTAHGTQVTQDDRRLAAGETGVVSAPTPITSRNRILRERVVRGWASSSATTRRAWATASGVPEAADHAHWSDVPGDAQSRLIGQWLDEHRDQFARPFGTPGPTQEYAPYTGARHRLQGPAEEVAARMFAHAPHTRQT